MARRSDRSHGGDRPAQGQAPLGGRRDRAPRPSPGEDRAAHGAGGKPQGHRDPRAAQRHPPRAANHTLIYGYHAVREALRSPRREVLKLFATEAAAARLAEEIAAKGATAQLVAAEEIARRLPADAVHQGVLLEARPLEAIDISEVPENGLVLALDQVTDPHNVGAIVRTAAAFGVDAIVTTERHSPEFSGVLAKSASGGLEHVAIAVVVNLSRALTELGEMGYLRVGLDSAGSVSLEAAALRRPLALVLGAEGKGLRRLTRENCDVVARLDFPGAIQSVNVSNACAVALTIARIKLGQSSG